MRLVLAVVMVAAVLVANSGCDEDTRKYVRLLDASQPSADAGHVPELADSGLTQPNTGGKAGKDGGSAAAMGGKGNAGGTKAGSDSAAGRGGSGADSAGAGAGRAGVGVASGGQGPAGTGGAGAAAGSDAPKDAGPSDGGMFDAHVPDDSCDFDDDAGTPHTDSFTVPSGGGYFEFCSITGLVRLEFPGALAGLQMTLTTLDPHAFAWPHPGFAAAMSDAIRIETSIGITEPIRVRLPNGVLLAFVFYDDSTVPLPLRLSDDRKSLELEHSGVLGILAPDRACESTFGAPFTNPWREDPHSGICSGFGTRSTWRHYECANEPFCQDFRSWCCVYPGDSKVGCTIDDGIHYNDFLRGDPNAAYSYCDDVSDSPYILEVSPSQLVANYMDQTVTLAGNNFQQGGFVYAGEEKGSRSSAYIKQSTWISSTSVSAVVSGQVLSRRPEIWYSYVNPDSSGSQFNWFRYSSNYIAGTISPPAVSCPVPLEGSPPLGVCGSQANGCQCSVDFNPGLGDGMHTYGMTCANGFCSCTRDGAIVVTKPRINACNNDVTTQDQWRQSCLSTPGFCP
jgi:hypothetical protein